MCSPSLLPLRFPPSPPSLPSLPPSPPSLPPSPPLPFPPSPPSPPSLPPSSPSPPFPPSPLLNLLSLSCTGCVCWPQARLSLTLSPPSLPPQMFLISKHQVKHDKLCLGSLHNRLVMNRCMQGSSDQYWEVIPRKHMKHK